jgi:hypothetical protein
MTQLSPDGQWTWNPQIQQWQPTQAAEAYPSRSVSKTRKRTSHGLHLFLTIVTCGVWGLFVWLPITLWHKFGPRARTVTRYGG